MADLTLELYHKDILRLSAEANGHGRLSDADTTAELNNPLCGDRVTVDLKIESGAIAEIGHEVKACALCQASMSALAKNGPGRSRDELQSLHAQVDALLKYKNPAIQKTWPDFAVFAPVAGHKSRYTCVLMPIDAALEAMKKA